MWKISDGLYLGTKADSQDRATLVEYGITHIVNCAVELPCPYPADFKYLELFLQDPDDQLYATLKRALDFIDRGRQQGIVLVHCTGGVSRSPAVVLAYLHHCGIEMDAAARQLSRQVQTRPNEIFLRQVHDYFGLMLTSEQLAALYLLLGNPAVN